MNHWRDIKSDLEMTSRRPAGDLSIHRRWVEKNGVVQWDFVPGRPDYLPYILQNGRQPSGVRQYPLDGFGMGPLPGLDHGRIYRTAEKRAILVWHPYGDPRKEERLPAWAKAAGVRIRYFDPAKSWYYPGHTYLAIAVAEKRPPLMDNSMHTDAGKPSQQLCWYCRNAVPSEDGQRGCEWSNDLRPVPGWDAEMVTKPGFGYTWRIYGCPKYVPDAPREKLGGY